MKDQVISIIAASTLILAAWAAAGLASQNTITSQADKLSVANTQGRVINADTMKKSINLYQGLSEDRKAAIKDKMIKMSLERQKAIKTVEKQIREYRLRKLKVQQAKNLKAQIKRLEALEEFAIKENAPETAKRFERLISLYENRQVYKSLQDNSLKVE